ETLEAAYAGVSVGQMFEGVRTVDAVLLLPDALRHSPAELGGLLISGPLGPVPMSQVATLRVTQDRYSIEHDGGQRRISVTFNVADRNLQDVVQEARQRIAASIKLPTGVFLEFSGAAAAEQQTRDELILYSTVALALIIVLLFMAFRWRVNAWLVMANLPFSL